MPYVRVGDENSGSIDLFYEDGPKGPERPVFRNIDIRDVTCRKAKHALNLRAFENSDVSGIHLERCRFDNIASKDVMENIHGLTFADVTVNGGFWAKAGINRAAKIIDFRSMAKSFHWDARTRSPPTR